MVEPTDRWNSDWWMQYFEVHVQKQSCNIYSVVHTCRDSVAKVYLKIKTVSTCKLQNIPVTWMRWFKLLVSCIYTRDCLMFAFMDLLETELNQIATEWTTHRMRPTRHSHSQPGIPDKLYFKFMDYNVVIIYLFRT